MPTLAYSSRRERRAWSDADDRELLRGIQRGSEEAFDQLITRKTGPLIQLAYRIVHDREEARDIVQLAFLRVWEKRASFVERWSPNTWLYRITTNLAIDHLRFRQSRERRAEPVRDHLLRVAAGRRRRQISKLQQHEVSAVFERVARCLSERQRTVFVLRAVEGLGSKEVARLLGCRASTVRNHLFTARKKLRAELERLYPEYAPAAAQPGVDDDAEEAS